MNPFDGFSCLVRHLSANILVLTASWSVPCRCSSNFSLHKSVAGLTRSFWTGRFILLALNNIEPYRPSNLQAGLCSMLLRFTKRCFASCRKVAFSMAGNTSGYHGGGQVGLLWNSKTTRLFQEIHNKNASVQCWDLCEAISVRHPLGWIASCRCPSCQQAEWRCVGYHGPAPQGKGGICLSLVTQ